ncbi:uncharacterized protein AKAW2_51492S [Aspergillus luchuensis]|uniref:Uncharacterized protein n=1 Tax=Aspergillus kawachii TaxID=1069201 RepID=A0A7R8A0H5_ASPKA|nr:uncharacterized protein AKAW2_51492S [Aspergillus luchuensis]BCS01151.1 hypothetical protein AKAW2_51492S [Aspergillus luchuensis]
MDGSLQLIALPCWSCFSPTFPFRPIYSLYGISTQTQTQTDTNQTTHHSPFSSNSSHLRQIIIITPTSSFSPQAPVNFLDKIRKKEGRTRKSEQNNRATAASSRESKAKKAALQPQL